MPILAKTTGGGDYEQAPAGNHIARCFQIVDCGLHEETWQDETSLKHKVRISWELPGAAMDDGRPFSISKEYTMSLHEKANLRKHLESWRGREFTETELQGFDLEQVINAPCMLNVVSKKSKDGTKTYAVVEAVTPMPKGVDCPALVNDTLVFGLDNDDADQVFEKLPEWLQNRINKPNAKPVPAELRQAIAPGTPYKSAPAEAEQDFGDDIPF